MFGAAIVLLIFVLAAGVCCAFASLPWVIALRARRIALAQWEYAVPLLGLAIFALRLCYSPMWEGAKHSGCLRA